MSLRAKLIRLAHTNPTLRPQLLPLLREAASPAGKAQEAILAYVRENDAGGTLTDIARHPSLRGVHFSQMLSATEALAKKGLVSWDGEIVVKTTVSKQALSSIGQTILAQMGGARSLSAMLGIGKNGYYFYDLPGNKGVGFSWPVFLPARGNNVEIMLMPDDTYTMTFSIRTRSTKRLVKKYTDISAKELARTFERHTGVSLSL